jgi:hypothetical protein
MNLVLSFTLRLHFRRLLFAAAGLVIGDPGEQLFSVVVQFLVGYRSTICRLPVPQILNALTGPRRKVSLLSVRAIVPKNDPFRRYKSPFNADEGVRKVQH